MDRERKSVCLKVTGHGGKEREEKKGSTVDSSIVLADCPHDDEGM
jgi:hypothetical protein